MLLKKDIVIAVPVSAPALPTSRARGGPTPPHDLGFGPQCVRHVPSFWLLERQQPSRFLLLAVKRACAEMLWLGERLLLLLAAACCRGAAVSEGFRVQTLSSRLVLLLLALVLVLVVVLVLVLVG
ncbi:hypothetical protein PLESTB_001685800 [Pleodorina starrii]|uniref:Uncharacterized protein n=1 Tax=Pleodorina starrii TaxID=330485 RepID=A0A9W6BZB4_9CHLO|nr:hypothetical protein PLESTB_001685800 [Pleodorina starrii]GLC66675.1 hypothetical protein PLESTF_000460000 [Pleodorina starrii]